MDELRCSACEIKIGQGHICTRPVVITEDIKLCTSCNNAVMKIGYLVIPKNKQDLFVIVYKDHSIIGLTRAELNQKIKNSAI